MRPEEQLYQTIILKHSKEPQNYGIMEHPSAEAHKLNMLCGDEVRVFVRLAGGKLERVMFIGLGCAVMKSSASMMTEIVHGCSVEEASKYAESLERFLKGDESALLQTSPLRVLQGVRAFPARIKCALLPWKALEESLPNQ
jgi:nitrogen fixation protein NifU and related proteins